MWDPDYMNYILDYFERQEIELPPSYSADADADALDRSYEEEEEEDEEEDDDDDDDDASVEENYGTSPSVQILSDDHVSVIGTSSQEAVNVNVQAFGSEVAEERVRENSSPRRNDKVGKGGETANGEGSSEGAVNKGEIDGLFCPICFEAWSSGGDHRVCCLPCGHIYGLSCIKKWLRHQGSSRCPQCKKKSGIKDIRLLYATQVVAVDGELQKKVRSLEVKCASIAKKNDDLFKKEAEWKKKEADLCQQMQCLKKRARDLEDLLKDVEKRALVSSASSWNRQGESAFGPNDNPKFHMLRCSNKFVIQKDVQVNGARLFDIDASSKIFVIARRFSGLGGMHVLTKMSLLYNHEEENIQLPRDMKAVKDLRVSPHSRLVLLASLGKKLSVLSTESNTTILTYDLPTAAWSCSWDLCSSHYVYAGLQNGTVLQFDMRYTMGCVESLTGFTGNPIHTVHSLSPDSSLNSGVRSVLTASSLGLCHWNFGRNEDRPYLIPESEKHGVCISLAYCATSDDIVASFRPKVEVSGDLEISQPVLTASASVAGGQAVRGSHVHFKKMDSTYQKLGATCTNVSDILLPKSVIVDRVFENPVFASGDEETHGLVLRDLPSLTIVERLKPQKHPIRDVRYTRALGPGLLCCLSEDSMQLFMSGPFQR